MTTMNDDLEPCARVRAAERKSNVSRYAGELIREQMAPESGYARAMGEYLDETGAIAFEDGSAEYPKRAELYDRPALH